MEPTLTKLVLTTEAFRNKVLGCWMGKTIGGTLGLPYEGTPNMLKLNYYDPVPNKPLGNDDLDLQLVWLHQLAEKSIHLNEHDMKQAWLNFVKDPFPDEYAKCYINMKKGLEPPVCGLHNNAFLNCMGAPIRSEIWACITPGCPSRAVQYAYNDAITDHGDEGVYGELFLAALESAAFCETDINHLLEIGLSFIPDSSDTARAIRIAMSSYKQGIPWQETRNAIISAMPTAFQWYAPTNVGFMVIGLLYGTDFDSTLCTAVNCGYDTDCVGATVGAILGIIYGAGSIPSHWSDPVGTGIQYDLTLVNFDVYSDINRLTDDTIKIGYDMLAQQEPVDYFVELDGTTIVFNTANLVELGVFELYRYGKDAISLPLDTGMVHIKYNGAPSIGYGQTKRISLLFENIAVESAIAATTPDGWIVTITQTGLQTFDLFLAVPESNTQAYIDISNTVGLDIALANGQIEHTSFVLLGQSTWLVSDVKKHISFTDSASEETALRLDPAASTVTPIQLNDDSIVPLFRGQTGIIYAQTSIYCPEERDILIALDCNDAITLWLNNDKILTSDKVTELHPSMHRMATTKTEARLHRGWNTVFIKLKNTRPDYEGYCFISSPKPSLMGYTDTHFDVFERSN